MKKLLFVLIIIALTLPVFAQSNSRNEGDMYYINVPLEKVYETHTGYVVQYRKGINQIGTVGLPYEWFTEAGGRAEVMKLPRGKNWPSLTIFYKEGVFSHIRLYIHPSRAHITWGVVPTGADVSRHFMDAESFKIDL